MLTCVLVGGFLGAGKTTALLALARRCAAEGRRVAVLTNDQGFDLVDTRLAASAGRAVAEVTGGCFCCRFDSLVDAVDGLVRDVQPDVIFAEPVGSCADLQATVRAPLARLHGERIRVAPLSVLADPLRAASALGLAGAAPFSADVTYIYEKQLEEADLIVLSKADLLPGKQRAHVADGVRSRFPRAEVLLVSAVTGEGIDAWLERLSATPAGREPLEIDYDRYALGESRLGWLNGRWSLAAPAPVDGNALLLAVAVRAQAALRKARIEIAHLKLSLAAAQPPELAVVQAVDGRRAPSVAARLNALFDDGELVVNLRAEGAPPALAGAIIDALGREIDPLGVEVRGERVEYFTPARPVPTHGRR